MAFHPERWTAFLTAVTEMEEGSADHTSLLGYMDANILPEMAEFLEAEEKLNRKRERLWRRRREEDINKKVVWKLKTMEPEKSNATQTTVADAATKTAAATARLQLKADTDTIAIKMPGKVMV